MRTQILLALFLALSLGSNSHAALIGGQDIISAPTSVIDDFPGATNDHQQAFDERQGVYLTSNLLVDGGLFIAAGTTVDSHMIFLNTPVGAGNATDLGVEWIFDGSILGVMSDQGGTLEAASSAILGAVGTIYPSAFAARGMESNDSYSVSGNVITVSMSVSEPGDWIRVVTAAVPMPEPPAALLLLVGLSLLAGMKRYGWSD